MKKSVSTVFLWVCLIALSSWDEAKAGLFDHDDKLPGELLGYKQPCPVRKCTFAGTANGDLDLHMQRTHPRRYAAALAVYNKSTFTAFTSIFRTLSSAASGGFEGTSSAVREFYNALRKAGADGKTIADILSSDQYD
jgi:hypothetical protein